jgi:uncharacterized protein YwqG
VSFFDRSKRKAVLDREAIAQLGRPALHISQDRAAHGFCKFGGLPVVPEGFEWPTWEGESLSFLLQLRLSEVNGDGYLPDLPKAGLLYVFNFAEQSPWGYDPNDRGSWRVLFFEETDGVKAQASPDGFDTRYEEKYVRARPIVTYPPMEDPRIGKLLGDNSALRDRYDELLTSVYDGEPSHHLGGYPDPIQSADMDLECQLVSNGLSCGDGAGYDDIRRNELEAGRGEWMLLLQIDTDDDIEMMWGDDGPLYFWIREADLKAKNFDDIWMILQCC